MGEGVDIIYELLLAVPSFKSVESTLRLKMGEDFRRVRTQLGDVG